MSHPFSFKVGKTFYLGKWNLTVPKTATVLCIKHWGKQIGWNRNFASIVGMFDKTGLYSE